MASFDGTPLTIDHADFIRGREALVVALPLGTKAPLIVRAAERFSSAFNVLVWQSRLILDPDIPLTDPAALSLASCNRDFVALLDYFHVGGALLLGYCSGAAAALHAAAANRDRVSKLALVGGAYFLRDGCALTQYEKDVLDLMPYVAAGREDAAYILGACSGTAGTAHMAGNEFMEEAYRAYSNVESFYRLGIGLTNFIQGDSRRAARSITAPTLIAESRFDTHTHYSSSMLIAGDIDRADVYVYDSGDHYDFCRANPLLMETILRAFTGDEALKSRSFEAQGIGSRE